MMRKRICREHVLRCLYAAEYAQETDPTALWDEFIQEEPPLSEKELAFVEKLLKGVPLHIEELDTLIARHTKRWSIDRLVRVDRIILRIAIYELLYCKKTPVGAVISEAVELANLYGEENSKGFVNGILGAVSREALSAGESTTGEVGETEADEETGLTEADEEELSAAASAE